MGLGFSQAITAMIFRALQLRCLFIFLRKIGMAIQNKRCPSPQSKDYKIFNRVLRKGDAGWGLD